MRSSAALALALALVAPSVARAQQPPIPPTGEPPPPETRFQEEDAIRKQATQTYVEQHKNELMAQAQSEVEQERRAAWEQRGRANIPPPVVISPPTAETNIAASCGAAGGDVLGLGISAAFKLRMKKWWGLEAGGGLLWLRDYESEGPPAPPFTAAFAELSVIGWSPGSRTKQYLSADHVIFRAGAHLDFPVGSADVPPVHIAPFGGVGGVFALGPLTKRKGYVGIYFECRVGYRFGVGGSGEESPIEGLMVDIMAGPAVGF